MWPNIGLALQSLRSCILEEAHLTPGGRLKLLSSSLATHAQICALGRTLKNTKIDARLITINSNSLFLKAYIGVFLLIHALYTFTFIRTCEHHSYLVNEKELHLGHLVKWYPEWKSQTFWAFTNVTTSESSSMTVTLILYYIPNPNVKFVMFLNQKTKYLSEHHSWLSSLFS